MEVMQDTGRADEAIGLDVQNGGKLTLGARTKVTVNHNSILQDGDSSNLYGYGIQKDASFVSLRNEANIISNGYTATEVYTHEDGAVTILGDFTSVGAHADYDYNAYGVWSDNSGINILGKESVITSLETGRGNSVALSASTGGANQVGDGTQLKADNEIGFAYGVKTNQGTNNLGENINISSYSSKLSAYGMATSGTQGITTVKDGLVIQTVADGGQARGIYNEQGGITTIGNKASINVTGLASSGYGMDVSGGKVKMGDNATIQVKGTSGYGISIGQETGSSTVEMGKNASITVESDDMSVGVLNDGGTMTAVKNFSSQVSGVIDSYGIVTADGGVTTIGSGAGISVEGENQLDTGGLWDVTPTIENGLNVYDEAGNVVGTKDEWYLTKLTKTVNDDTRPLLYSGDSTYAMYRRSIDTLRQRRGNLRQRGKTEDDSGIWVRNRGGQMEGDGWDSRYNIFQLGYEYSDTAGSVYGFFGERGIALPDYETGSGKEHTLIQILWLKLVVMIQRLIYPDKANYRTGEQSLSIEHGRTLYRGKDRSFFIEP